MNQKNIQAKEKSRLSRPGLVRGLIGLNILFWSIVILVYLSLAVALEAEINRARYLLQQLDQGEETAG